MYLTKKNKINRITTFSPPHKFRYSRFAGAANSGPVRVLPYFVIPHSNPALAAPSWGRGPVNSCPGTVTVRGGN